MSFAEFVNGGLATGRPVARTFEFAGQQIEGYFLDLPALKVRELLRDETGERDARFLAAVVCDAAGNPLLTVEQAASLKAQHLAALMTEALRALGLSPDAREDAKKP